MQAHLEGREVFAREQQQNTSCASFAKFARGQSKPREGRERKVEVKSWNQLLSFEASFLIRRELSNGGTFSFEAASSASRQVRTTYPRTPDRGLSHTPRGAIEQSSLAQR